MARSPWISDLHWVRAGRQARSQRTQEALLDAAQELFSRKGSDATSVADVAAHAGCSVGALYHHFRDKKALLYALLRRDTEDFRATTRAAVDPARWEGAGIADILKAYLEFSLEVSRSRPGLDRAALEASLRDPELRAHLVEARAELDHGLTALLLARRDEIGHPDPPVAIAVVLDQIASVLSARREGLALRAPLVARSDADFVREALRSACAYLELPQPPATEAPS